MAPSLETGLQKLKALRINTGNTSSVLDHFAQGVTMSSHTWRLSAYGSESQPHVLFLRFMFTSCLFSLTKRRISLLSFHCSSDSATLKEIVYFKTLFPSNTPK